jgi:hypothetical protein
MDIQVNVTGNNVTSGSSRTNVVSNVEKTFNSISSNLPSDADVVEISPQTIALTKALSSVAQDIEAAKNKGYPFPPPYVTNDKQLDIIKTMVKGKLSGSVDESTLSDASEMLWKNAGYRLDTAIRPSNTSGSGNIYNFLTKSDRESMDKVYDQAASEGLDAIKVTREAAAALSMKRMKEVDVANGVIMYDESGITPLSTEDLAKLAEEERIKQTQPKKNESLDTLQKSLSTMKKSLSINELLLSFLQKNNNQIP